eukprot:SAG31_NODE_33330_length_345_cov_0.642276_1_plen_56_part_01
MHISEMECPWGTELLIGLVVFRALYLGSGVLYGVHRKGSAPSLQANPHWPLWLELA